MKRIAECMDCLTAYFHNNAPSTEGPKPIYGAYGMRDHEGHNVRIIDADAVKNGRQTWTVCVHGFNKNTCFHCSDVPEVVAMREREERSK